MKKLKRLFFYLSLALVVVITSAVLAVFLYKDQIIKKFIAEANKNLSTPIRIGKIDISPWHDFPNMAIIFSDVYIEDSHPGNYPLLTAEEISFYLNPIEAWQGKYSIRGLQIKHSETHLKIDPEGRSNYIILKESSGSKQTTAFSFNLKNVSIHDAQVFYKDQYRNQDHSFYSEKLLASIDAQGDLYKIDAGGLVAIEKIGVQSYEFLKGKNFEVQADLLYNDDLKILQINPSRLQLRNSQFKLTGSYQFKDKNLINIHCEGENTDIQTLISLMPENITHRLNQYQSDGEIYFQVDLKGEISSRKSPAISVQFGCSESTLFHPDYQAKIKNANLKGSFNSTELTDLSKAVLTLENVNGQLNGRDFTTDLSIKNFKNPYVSFHFKGDLEAAAITNFYPINDIKDLSGEINVDVTLEGYTELLKKKSTAQQVRTSGTIEMRHLFFTYSEQNIQLKGLTGILQFTNNDLALSNVKGQLENTDFRLNGFFKNIITFLIFENQPIGIEADLQSNYVDLDQLFELGFGQKGTEDFKFTISQNLHLNFNCDVKSMHYKRFKPTHIIGNLFIKNQTAIARNIEFNSMGGTVSLNGIADARNSKAIDVISSFKVTGIQLDSAFYVFENFHQQFIEDRHLKGRAIAEVELEMTLDDKLRLFQETLIANITTTITNGELNDFEPLYRLDKYLDDDGLKHLRFAELKNDIHISNKTVFIPQMEVRSNVTNIQISGTHTFDQHIDYRVIAPLRSRKKIDPDEAFGAIEDSQTGQSRIFLKIIGTAENYRVLYDKDAVKKKIASDLKKEAQELKDAFKLKGKIRKKEIELEEDDYFEWSDSTRVDRPK